MTKPSAFAGLVICGLLGLTACGGNPSSSAPEVSGDGAEQKEAGNPNAQTVTVDPQAPKRPADQTTVSASALVQWWHSSVLYSYWNSWGWNDTDLFSYNWTAVQLRHNSRLIAYGVYEWGYMPTFVDLYTGQTFRFLHLHPQYQQATRIGAVYGAGYVVGYSGGASWDTGGAGRGYSTGAHLCVQTRAPYRAALPYWP